MNSSLISQITLVIMSVVLIVMYVRPGFETITNLQDEQSELQDAIGTANEFTRALQQLQAKVQSISTNDTDSLRTYLPDEVDRLTTMWVIESIASEANVDIASISAAGGQEGNENSSTGSVVQGTSSSSVIRPDAKGMVLTVGVAGTYENFQEFLRLLEVNEFPFLTQKLTIGSAVDSSEGGGTEGSASSGNGTYTLTLLVPEFQPTEANNSRTTDIMDDDMMMEGENF